jgi:ligand-binding SRPBCC domain-containing protein
MVKLDLCTVIHAPVERCFDLARSIEVHLLGTERTGEQAIGGVTTGLIGPGQFVRWRARHLCIKQHLSSQITGYDRPIYFQDTMIEGAFQFMQHDHFFREVAPHVTEMTDHFVFAAPLSILGIAAETLLLRRYMTNLLLHRNEVLKQIAESDRWSSLLASN